MDFWSLGLTIAVVILVAALVYSQWKIRQVGSTPGEASSGSIPIRKNVLILMFFAYGALLGRCSVCGTDRRHVGGCQRFD